MVTKRTGKQMAFRQFADIHKRKERLLNAAASGLEDHAASGFPQRMRGENAESADCLRSGRCDPWAALLIAKLP
jgi:hypothetical protein